jgi:hypothetical protein
LILPLKETKVSFLSFLFFVKKREGKKREGKKEGLKRNLGFL